MLRRFAVIPAALIVLSAYAAGSVAAAAGGAAASHGPLGMVNPYARAGHGPPKHTNNLTYHGGPVMHANRVYTIFWGPASSWDSGYISTINTYFNNVHLDSGQTTNVYYSDSQYTDGSGAANYDVTFGGTYNDTNAYPAQVLCTDKATPKRCLTDGQLQTEIQADMSANRWTATGIAGTSDTTQNIFFLFTPVGVGSCAGSSCAYTTYCAYHNWMGSPSGTVLYANMPYANQNYRIYTCNSGQWPNGVSADATINLISHEHNETITDEQGNAWYDSSGAENGDKCAWNFGSATGPSGGKYNQTINGTNYYLQQEWSNQSSGCVLSGL
jgi:hypothetical protein